MGRLLFFLLFAVNAAAADKWTHVRSRNFTVVGNAPEAQIRSVAYDFEQFREAFGQIFSTSSKSTPVPITIVVLKNDEAAKALSGNFQRGDDQHFIVVTGGTPIPRSIYHQYVHELTRDIPNSVPLWFTEGLAEFYSALEIVPKEKKYALGQRIPEHADLLKKGPLMPLEDLFAVDRGWPQYNERERRSAFSAQSWAMVNYLILGLNSSRQPAINGFLAMVSEGKSGAESFQAAFKTDLKSMLSELDSYAREKAVWEPKGAPLKDQKEIDRDIKARTLSEAEAEFYLGDMLLHLSRLTDAATHLQQATVLEPKLAVAQASMGILRYREDKADEAVEFLTRAVTLDPANYVSQYNLAFVLDKNSMSPLDNLDAKRNALAKVIELAPGYAPAYELLAYINLTADIDYDGTIELLQKANNFAPGNLNLRFLMTQALVKKEDYDQAGKILQSLVKNNAADQPIREGAQNLINLIARKNEGAASQREADIEAARKEDEAMRAQAAARRAAVVTPEPAKEVSGAAAPAPSRAKSGELVLVSPQKARPTGTKVTGTLTLMDCRDGVTMTIKSDTGSVILHTASPDRIAFVTFVANGSTSIACGIPPGGGVRVTVTYRPTPGGTSAGEPLEVEFIEN